MSAATEAGRQQALLQAVRAPHLQGLPPGAVPLPGRAGALPDAHEGLRAYRANAQAVAQRALAAAYPVLLRLIGDEAFAALARDLWLRHPPTRGDLAWFGAEAAEWIGGCGELASLPYLADVARLEWAVHAAHTAADPADTPPDLQALAHADPQALRVLFGAGHALVRSAWPVLAIWRAHQGAALAEPDLATARAAMADGRGDNAWVWRLGHRVEVAALADDEATFASQLAAGLPLAAALESTLAQHSDFSFEAWLMRALRDGWLAGFGSHPPSS
jgi:hypothetical protein